jgi:hypothetical protein
LQASVNHQIFDAGMAGAGVPAAVAVQLHNLGVMVQQLQHQQEAQHAHVVAGLQLHSLAQTLQSSQHTRSTATVQPAPGRQPISEAEARRNRAEAAKAAVWEVTGHTASVLGSHTANEVPLQWTEWKGQFTTIDSKFLYFFNVELGCSLVYIAIMLLILHVWTA